MPAVSITIQFGTYEEAAAFLSRPAVPPAAEGKPAKPAKGTTAPEPAAPAQALRDAATTGQIAIEGANPALTPAPAPAPAPELTAGSAITYPQVGEKIAALVAKDRPKAVEILGTFGVKKGPDLKPEQWPDVLGALNAALDALS